MSDYLPGGALNPDFLCGIALGNIPDAVAYHVFGRRDGVGTTVLEDITAIPTAAVMLNPGGIQLALKSSSAADTATGPGTGIASICLVYLDTDNVQQEELVLLNGLALVNTAATNINKVQSMHSRATGTNTTAVGNISLVNVGDTLTYEYITAGSNRSLSCRFHVPAGHNAYVTGWECSAVTKRVDFRLRANVDVSTRTMVLGDTTYLAQDAVVLANTASGWVPFPSPLSFPALSSIKVSAVGGTAGGDAGCSFHVVLMKA